MPPHTTRPPGRTLRSASTTSDPTGAKMIAASSCSGGRCSDAPQAAPSDRAICATMCGAEAVDAQNFPRARLAETAIADQPGARQRRNGRVSIGGWQAEAVPRVRYRQLGIAVVALVTGEASALAEIFLPTATVSVGAAGPAHQGTPTRSSSASRPSPEVPIFVI